MTIHSASETRGICRVRLSFVVARMLKSYKCRMILSYRCKMSSPFTIHPLCKKISHSSRGKAATHSLAAEHSFGTIASMDPMDRQFFTSSGG
jgi:hypothetical protein